MPGVLGWKEKKSDLGRGTFLVAADLVVATPNQTDASCDGSWMGVVHM